MDPSFERAKSGSSFLVHESALSEDDRDAGSESGMTGRE